jgi:hypothetical protein
MFSHQARCETFLLLRLQNLRCHERNTSQVKHTLHSHISSFVAVRACRFGSEVHAVCVRLPRSFWHGNRVPKRLE